MESRTLSCIKFSRWKAAKIMKAGKDLAANLEDMDYMLNHALDFQVAIYTRLEVDSPHAALATLDNLLALAGKNGR